MEINRGDIVIAILPGDYGKGRPALVVQSNVFNVTHASIVVCPVTSHLVDAPLFRVQLQPSAGTGLRALSQVMVDKMMAIKRQRIAQVIGHVNGASMRRIDRSLQIWLTRD